jgi:hypothetical protein
MQDELVMNTLPSNRWDYGAKRGLPLILLDNLVYRNDARAFASKLRRKEMGAFIGFDGGF